MSKRLWRIACRLALPGLLVATGTLCAQTVPRTDRRPARNAIAILRPTKGTNVKGTVHFHESRHNTHIFANLTGLPPGRHGIHIHEIGDCSAPDAGNDGGHFNPQVHKHGAPDASDHHAGDLGNIEADAQGRGRLDWTVDFLTVWGGPNSVIGKTVIVHAQQDDLQSQPDGNSGSRLACGKVQLKTKPSRKGSNRSAKTGVLSGS